mgnify:CR=1 FL=1
MKRIITSISVMTVVLGAVIGGAGAFFSDTETSAGNVFTAGAIDLTVDNESYYNTNACVDVNADPEQETWQWQGNAPYPVPGTACITSFLPSNLNGLFFFDFHDLKPDDEGEDTISLHVGTNDAYACMDLGLTSDDDKSSTEPELDTLDALEDPGNAWDGELADALQFFWWADDGDNVYEVGESSISGGVHTLSDLATTTGSFKVTLADSENNVWDPNNPNPDPIPGDQTVYIAKAWCLGTLTTNNPVATGRGVDPSVDSGVDCDGELLGNEYQTDGVELNVVFTAIQARHNEEFLCNPPELPLPTLTVNKIITADTAGIDVSDFALHIVGPNGDQIVSDNVPVPNLPTGSYTVYEVITGDVSGKTFTTTIGGACTDIGNDDIGEVTLNLGDNLVCTINNVENP